MATNATDSVSTDETGISRRGKRMLRMIELRSCTAEIAFTMLESRS